MRKFKYIKPTNIIYNLSENKTYDLIDYIVDSMSGEDNNFDKIVIINDKGILKDYYMFTLGMQPVFEEVTMEYRNSIIDGILK